MKKYMLTAIFIMICSASFAQSFAALNGSVDTNMKYQIIEDFSNGREIWEFFENGIKYVFMKTNIYSNPSFTYFEYNTITKKRMITIEGSEAEWIQGERSITCSGIKRIFTIAPTSGDK